MIENLPTKVDDVGRIVIPKKARKILNIQYNEELLLTVKKNKIELRKQENDKELNIIKEKIKKIEENYDIDFLVAADSKIIFTTKNYEQYQNKELINEKKSNITYSENTKLTKEDILKIPHYYSILSFDDYTEGQIFVIFENEENKKIANLFINLLIR